MGCTYPKCECLGVPANCTFRDENTLTGKVKEFFSYMDRLECSDNGRWFRPNVISIVRCLQAPKIEAILEDMRRLVGLDQPVSVRELNDKAGLE